MRTPFSRNAFQSGELRILCSICSRGSAVLHLGFPQHLPKPQQPFHLFILYAHLCFSSIRSRDKIEAKIKAWRSGLPPTQCSYVHPSALHFSHEVFRPLNAAMCTLQLSTLAMKFSAHSPQIRVNHQTHSGDIERHPLAFIGHDKISTMHQPILCVVCQLMDRI